VRGGQDVWVHSSHIESTGYRTLDAGDLVEFDFTAARQDSFAFVAARAKRLEAGTCVVIAPAGTPDTPMTPQQ
jgi:CspA family cold shock protein